MDKRKTQIIHSISRAEERYNVKLTEDDINKICKKIRKNLVKDGYSFSLTRTRVFHIVEYMEKEFSVIYDKNRKTLNTFLPSDCNHVNKVFEYYEGRSSE